MARPSKLTPKLTETICAFIRTGNFAKVAAEAAGISEATFYRWLSDEGDQFREFQESVARASAEAEVAAVEVLQAAFQDDWRAALEFLKRRFPERWQDRSRHDHAGKDGGPIEIKLSFDPGEGG